MSLLSKIPIFFAAEPTGGLPAGELGKEDIVDFLSQEDDAGDDTEINLEPKPKKQTKEDDKPKTDTTIETDDDEEVKEPKEKEDEVEDEEDDDLAELERELEGPTEEQLELITPVRRKEILAAYPDLFKKFPYLERAYYREQEFTELYPTIEDAKVAAEKATTLDKFEADVMDGNITTILKAIKAEAPQSFYKTVDNYMATLREVDEQAYFHLLGNQTKHLIASMLLEARKSNNEALQSAAAMVNTYVFGSTEFTPPGKLSKEDTGDKKVNEELSKKQEAFNQKQYQTAKSGLDTKVNNSITKAIEKYLDPKGSMNDYAKKNAMRDCHETLSKLFIADKRFSKLVDKLWEKAFESDFSDDAVDKIRRAYIGKAGLLLPSVIKKARNEAYKGMGKRVKAEKEEEETPSSEKDGKPKTPKTASIKKSGDIPRGMSTLDFLNAD